MNTKQIAVGGALAIVATIVLVGLMGSLTGADSALEKGRSTLATSGVQDATLTFKNYRYEVQPATLVKGVPVRMKVDLESVTGCMRDVVISQFGVRKLVSAGDDVIEFTPDKSGTFTIACSMNMGRGTFTVADPDGKTSDFVQAPAEVGGLCGSGGCGCGS